MATASYHITNCKGHKLYCEHYAPEGDVKGILVWHHGLGDHICRYPHFFKAVAKEGVAVYTHDAHSHGNSEPEMRCLINNFDDLIDDVYLHLDEIKKKHDVPLPLFVGGQSMGGLVSAHVVLRKQEIWSGLVLASAAIDVLWTPLLRVQAALGNVLANLVPKAQLVPAVQAEDMSQDPEVVKHFLEDKKIFHGNTRARTANEVLKGMKRIAATESQLAVPILAVHGTADRTTMLHAVKRLLQNCSSKDKTLKEVEGGYHELLMGPEKDEVIGLIAGWLQQHATAAAATAPATEAATTTPAQAAAATPAADVSAAEATSESKL